MSDSYGAIVVGGSIAGLLVARALVDQVGSVLVLDRDVLPEEPAVRRCAAQGGQVHALLDSGREAIEALLPGLFDEIVNDGGLVFNLGRDMSWYHAGHFKVRCDTRFDCHVQTRPFLEHHIRRRVLAVEGITVRAETRVTGLVVVGRRVAGVTVRGEGGLDEHLAAPIVIDAAGRGSQAVRWLQDNGFAAPPTSEVAIGLGYASRTYRLPAQSRTGARLHLTYGTRSRTTRHGLLFQVEGGLWQASLMGYGGDHPPADPEGFEAWMGTLERSDLQALLADAEPVSDVRVFKVPKQIRRHFDRIRLPEGFAVVGDAACALDPVFGQGMSVAAITARDLHRHLAREPFSSRAVARIAARAADRPWLVTAAEAMRYPQAERVPGIGLLHWFLDRVFAASARDAVVHRAFLEVLNLHRHAAYLFRPDLLLRILRGGAAEASPLENVDMEYRCAS